MYYICLSGIPKLLVDMVLTYSLGFLLIRTNNKFNSDNIHYNVL